MSNFISFSDLKSKRVITIFFLLVLLSVFIGYLISPQIIFQPISYQEGDIILQTIHVNEDLLVPDKVSTRLKREKLLAEQRRIFDFDPRIFNKSQQTIHKAFSEKRELHNRLQKLSQENKARNRTMGLEYFSLVSELQLVKKQITYYYQYRRVLQDRLAWFENAGSLTAKDFKRKAKTDDDLNTTNQILAELAEKAEVYQIEIAEFEKKFIELEAENDSLFVSIEEKKQDAINSFFESLSIERTEFGMPLVDFPYYSSELETKLLVLLSDVLSRKIVVSKEILPEAKEKLEVRNLDSGETSVEENLDEFIDLTEARTLVNDVAKETYFDDETGKQKKYLVLLGQQLISPTVFENKLEYENRKSELIAKTSPVFFSVKKGEVIARAGDRVTNHQVELINSYYEHVSNQDKIPGTIGVSLLVFFALSLIFIIFSLANLKFKTGHKDILMIICALLITLLLVKGGSQIVELIETRYFSVQGQVFNLVLPVALGSMLVGILLGFESALMVGLLTAMLCAIMMQNNLNFFIYTIMGCIVASLPMTNFDSRYSILIHGLKISAINLPIMLIIQLIESNQFTSFSWVGMAAALASGVLTAICASILLPIFESVFDITTNLKLLELSNMNHPALKELILKAPGTYQHSIIVGNLAESGASKIGANPLLSRVAAYYHDIGKVSDPQYFIENQAPNLPNIHDEMDPFESARIIIEHLQTGAEKSEKFRLGKRIANIVLQHHGTNMVKYFFNKAKKLEEKGHQFEHPIEEERFRYPGPKPQTLEAALVMLADVSEACCRSLDSPTPELIEKMTKKVCWNVLEDGQLDESGMTLKIFHDVVDVYATMLTSFYHQRVKYPENLSLLSKQSLVLEN